MSYSLAELRAQNPMWYFERNYSGVINLMHQHGLLTKNRAGFIQEGHQIDIEVVERTRYTLLLAIKHRFCAGAAFLSDLVFKVRVYLDAALAEVVDYQGHRHLLPRYLYPNERMFQPDEKRQANLLLHDWLTTWIRVERITANTPG